MNDKDVSVNKFIKVIIIVIIIVMLILGFLYFGQSAGWISLSGDIRYFADEEGFTTIQTNLYNDIDGIKVDPYEFEVKSYISDDRTYKLVLVEDLENSDLTVESFRYELKQNDKQIALGDLSDLDGEVLYSTTISNKALHSYELRIWLSQDNELDDVVEKKYAYKIIMEEVE